MPLVRPLVAAFGLVREVTRRCSPAREDGLSYFLFCSSCITGQTSEARASYLISAVCEATASHFPLRFTKTSVHT